MFLHYFFPWFLIVVNEHFIRLFLSGVFLLQGEVLDFFPRGFGCLTKELMVRGEDVDELGGVRDDTSWKRGSVIGIGQGGFLFGI